jgi:hypothetical protein
LLFAFACLFAISCKKDSLNDSSNLKTGYYPNTIGSFWEYRRFDSISNSADTVIVRIKSNVFKSGKLYSIWTYETANAIFDTSFVYTSKDSVIISGSNNFFSSKILLLPYRINSKWSSSGMSRDTSIVEGTAVIDSFDTYKLSRQIFGIDLSMYDAEWLTPYVGVIRENISEFSIIRSKNESWQLIAYSIK